MDNNYLLARLYYENDQKIIKRFKDVIALILYVREEKNILDYRVITREDHPEFYEIADK